MSYPSRNPTTYHELRVHLIHVRLPPLKFSSLIEGSVVEVIAERRRSLQQEAYECDSVSDLAVLRNKCAIT